MKNTPQRLVGTTVTLDGRAGTITRWCQQPGGLEVEITWTDGTVGWAPYHSVHG